MRKGNGPRRRASAVQGAGLHSPEHPSETISDHPPVAVASRAGDGRGRTSNQRARMPRIRRPGSTTLPQEPTPPPGDGSPGAPPPLQLPEDTTPTWELEMLVSGAVLVGLFQLPPVIDDLWREVVPRLSTHFTSMGGTIVFGLVKGMVYALIVAFVVHLVSRAYWVALVGLDSVFPQGIRWDRVVTTRSFRREDVEGLIRPLPDLISRLDNFCSVVFAVGFLAVSLALAGMLGMSAAAAISWVLSATVGSADLTPQLVFPVFFALVITPRLLRRRVLPKLEAGSRAARWLERSLRYSFDAIVLRLFGSLSLTLTSNIRRRRILGLTLALLMTCVMVAVGQAVSTRDNSNADVFPGLPETLGAHTSDYLNYADQRLGADAFGATPFIQSDVIRDPYVRLFIPYVPRQDGAELRACQAQAGAGARPAGAATAGGAARRNPDPDAVAVACLARIHAVTLNGRPLAALEYRFYTDAASRLQGIVAYIPVADLPRGRNELVVRHPPPPGEGPQRPILVSIPFWL